MQLDKGQQECSLHGRTQEDLPHEASGETQNISEIFFIRTLASGKLKEGNLHRA
jgi:hypothetical protein